jgi:O-antigen ligase
MAINMQAGSISQIPHAGNSRLVMTDYGFLLALGFAMLVAVDPFEAELERRIYTKHLPMLLALSSLILAMVGARIFRWQQKRPSSLPTLAPLLLLAAFVITGGLYARTQLGIQNSFLVAGLYMLAAPMAAAILLRCEPPVRLRLLHAYFAMLVAAGMVVFVGLAANYGVRQVYHELEYLFPPLAVLCAFLVKRAWLRWTGVLFFLLFAALFKKNTGYITGLLVAGYLVMFYFWPRWAGHEALRRLTKAHWLLIGTIALAILAAYLIANRDRYLPSGNPAYRMVTYEQAWRRFQDSPLIGTGFTGAAAEKFTAFDIGVANNVLPSHSDVLDIFAHGGLLGVSLWLWAQLRVIRLALGTALRARWRSHLLAPYAHTLACMSLAGVLTYAFNPIMLQPAKALLLWVSFGFLVAIALTIRQEEWQATNKNQRRGPV